MATQNSQSHQFTPIAIGILWCLAWGNERKPQYEIDILKRMRQALQNASEPPEQVRSLIQQVHQLQSISDTEFPENIEALREKYPDLWHCKTRIGLVYGGATKIKQYVFEATKLPDIRGASALLDRVNLVDLPAFFKCEEDSQNYPQCHAAQEFCQQKVRDEWLNLNFPDLPDALIPELIIYSTGGNILAFCPAALVDDLANAIEKRYTEETLTANSCAVGETFRLLELRFGLFNQQAIENTPWLNWYRENHMNPLVQTYYALPQEDNSEPITPEAAFQSRKSFNELAGRLAGLFNQRRNGNTLPENRPNRRYPPMFETHPYLRRDSSQHRSAITHAKRLPGEPWFSESSARKRYVGQMTKREDSSCQWYRESGLNWQPSDAVQSWVNRFEAFLEKSENAELRDRYYGQDTHPEEARSIREIANASHPKGFVAYIYADGNNMGGYIQKIKTPEAYQQFSRDISVATEQSVYQALAQHLCPHKLKELTDPDTGDRNGMWIHPFEILTIGGDDVMLIVPAHKALAIAQTIGETFESQLLQIDRPQNPYIGDRNYNSKDVHRYRPKVIQRNILQSKLSTSIGVLIAAEDTPIYYAEKLTSQLLKSAKKYAKTLAKKHYYGGTIDFLVLKSVTMISSNIEEFRRQGLTRDRLNEPKLKFYGAPYTLYEIGGLISTAQALKATDFPRSQLYQIRSLLERGKRTAILNYRYFRIRLANKQAQSLLEQQFENTWCKSKAEGSNGNLAPWMSLQEEGKDTMTYETIWRELVDLYPFIDIEEARAAMQSAQEVVSP